MTSASSNFLPKMGLQICVCHEPCALFCVCFPTGVRKVVWGGLKRKVPGVLSNKMGCLGFALDNLLIHLLI